MRFLMCVLLCFLGGTGCFAEELWLIEQDFVKFGKGEAYERYKKALLEGFWKGAREDTCAFAEQGVDAAQFFYLIPVKNWSGLGRHIQRWEDYEESLGEKGVLPFLSTINFMVNGLYAFLPECSFVPQGKGSLLSTRVMRYMIFGVAPTGSRDVEKALCAIAQAQKGSTVCLRTWKVIIGGETSRYLTAVFAGSEREAQQLGEQLDLSRGPLRHVLRSQKGGTCILRSELSFSEE